jgi:peptidylprolyl isomerase
VRKTSAVLASLSLAVLALTGCSAAGSADSSGCDRSADATAIKDAVTVEGEVGTAPDVTVFSPLHLKKSSVADVTVGDGRAIVNGQQALTVELSIFSGETGEKVYATSYDEDKGQVSNADYWASQSPGLAKAFECATEGSRILAGLTPDDFGKEALSGLGLSDEDNMVFVIDVLDVFLPKAEGALQFNDAQGMPTVVRAADGTPGVIIPDSAAPTKQVVQTLIKGDGDKVAADQIPLLNVTAVNWDDKKVVSSTWGQGPTGDLASTAPTVAEALVGKTVGSQLLVVTPGTEGAGAVVYVVDILGAVTAPTQ